MKKIGLMLMIGMLVMSACSESKKDEAAGTDATQVKVEKNKVKLADVKIQPVDQLEEFTATVEADVVNNIAPSTPVRIKKIYVEVGDNVRKGQKLVLMDDVNLVQTQTQMENQEMEFNRVDELYKVGGASKSEWDAKKMALDVTKRAYQNLVENTTLLSPINGVVTARNYDDGDLFGGASPVLTVEQIAPVKLIINVSELYYAQIKKGMEVQIKLDVYSDETFTGKVSLIYPTIDASTRTFPVEVTLPNADRRVRPGMFARVIVNFGTLDHVVVPDLAIVKQVGSGDRYVYVYKDGKVSYNKVILGRRMGATYELISGVENNSQVVIAGQNRLTNGMEVEVEK